MRGKEWLPNDTATLRRMNAAGYSDGEIAKHTGHCESTVLKRRKDLGLDGSTPRTRALKRSLEIERMSK